VLGFDDYLHGHDDGLYVKFVYIFSACELVPSNPPLQTNTSVQYFESLCAAHGLYDGSIWDRIVCKYCRKSTYKRHWCTYVNYRQGTNGSMIICYKQNYDSAGKGGNRFATVLLYMSDAVEGAGGETVFSEAWPPGHGASEQKPLAEAISELRASGDAAAAGIEKGSWQEKMVATCRTKLSVRPWRGRAVLFYSQFPDGKVDSMSKHGGCPVLNDQPKWAANLWVWNT
jgi:hypothetical protein